ncbi:ninjurin-1-like [Cryptotermes secundus]|uniref:ninjurin-1-like n=1 Tax=Cryptotermes secundus TaxID=105785 RepID=UPI000CD7BF71|nr:ninjurin-1-like [Cryptotermes secundus]
MGEQNNLHLSIFLDLTFCHEIIQPDDPETNEPGQQDPEQSDPARIDHVEQRQPLLTNYHKTKAVLETAINLALLTSNISQCTYIYKKGPYNTLGAVCTGLLLLSIVLQVAVGFAVIRSSKYDINKRWDMMKAEVLDTILSYVICVIFVICCTICINCTSVIQY